MTCLSGKKAAYTIDDTSKPVCRTVIPNCRYYRVDREACFECENTFAVTSTGTCAVCANGNIGINLYGERVCVTTMVPNCLIYTANGS